MKKLLFLMCSLSWLMGQNILISDGGTVAVSGGEMFYDAGGAGGNDNNNSYTITLTPAVPGEVVCVDIQSLILSMTSWEYVGQADLLRIYDGPTTADDQLASLTGDFSTPYNAAGNPYHVGHDAVGGIPAQLSPGMFCANNPSGVLTFEFVNQLSSTAPGWEAEVFTFPRLVPGCNITLSADQASVCAGTNVNLEVLSSIVSPSLMEDFNSGSLNPNWNSTPGALSFVNVLTCEPNNGYTTLNTDNSIYAWMQNVPAPRTLETMDFDASNGGYISFDFRMASDDGAGNGCETPDIGTEEGVFVQYSTNSGGSWTTMKLMFPGEESGASAGIGYQVYDWNKVTLMIPAGAYSTTTRFRWIQANSTSSSEDSWGIDNVEVATYGSATLTVTDITSSTQIYSGGILNQQFTVTPMVTTTYEAVIDDGMGNSCSQQITITVTNCSCTDDVGTMTESVSTARTNNDAANDVYILCDQDRFFINHNGDFVNSDALNPLVDYYIYTCPPTPGVEPLLDPCAAIASNGVPISYYDNIVLRPDLEEYNNGGNTADIIAYLTSEGITVNNNTVWFKPVTIDFDGLNNIIDPNCFADGDDFQITYLNPINVVATEDCATGTVSFQVSGGYPEFFAGNYQITNTGSGTLSAATLTPTTPGEVMTFTITGLNDADSYSFTINDSHSCPFTFTPAFFTSCGCNADIGTVQVLIDGVDVTDNINNYYAVCADATINFEATGFTLPNGINPTYGYAILSGPPTTADPYQDPAFLGDDEAAISSTLNNATYQGATFWVVPVTLDEAGDAPEQLDANGDACYAIGTPMQVDFLLPITAGGVEDCANGSVDITVLGGLPEVDGSNYIFSNIQPATASITGTASHNGTVTLSGLNNGDNYSVDITDANGCTFTFNGGTYTDCSCNADIGIVQVLIDGVDVTDNVNNYYAVCADATINFEATGFTLPNGTNPTYGYAILSGPPTTADPYQDPAFLGDDEAAISSTLNNATYQGATFWVVPVTLDEAGDAPDQLDANGDVCYAIGTPMQVDFLLPITAGGVEDCANGSVDITVLGGLPEVDGSNYIFSNIQPATASITGTASHNGTVTLTGLNNGDNYSVDITDDNGCTFTFTGGPFIGGPQPVMVTLDQTICGTSLLVEVVASDVLNTLLWTLPANVNTSDALNGEQINVQFTSNGLYTLVFNEDNGACNTAVQVNITVDSLGVSALATNANCGANDGSIQLTQTLGTAIQNITCTDGIGAAAGVVDLANLEVTGLIGGTYTIQIDNANCSQTLNVVVTNNGAPTLTIDATTDLLCFEDGSGAVTASVTGNTGALTYTLTGGNDNVNLNQLDNGIFNGLAAGDYTLTVEDNTTNCTAFQLITLLEPNELLLSVSNDTLVCDGASINLFAYASGGSGVYVYTFDGVNNGANNQYNYTVNGAQNLSISVNDGQCPVVTESINITVHQALDFTLSYTPNPAVICPGETMSLSANVNSGSGNYTYNWMLDGNSVSNNPTLNTPLNQSSTISVEVSDACETGIETVDVTVENLQAPTLNILIYEQCEVGDAVINIENPNANFNYQWSFSDGNSASGVTMYNLVSDIEGCVDLTLEITNSTGTCSVQEVYEDVLCVYPNPVAAFSFSTPITVSNSSVAFTNVSTGATSYDWDFGDGVTSSASNPTHTYPSIEGEVYTVVLTATNDSTGCFDEVAQTLVILEDFVFYMPNAFTPNDDEHNAILKPIVSGIEISKKYEFRIFDRWGNILFYTTNPQEGWDGVLNNGKVAKDGVYVWKVELFNKVEGKGEIYQGHVNLIK